jgi:hypothetical protein
MLFRRAGSLTPPELDQAISSFKFQISSFSSLMSFRLFAFSFFAFLFLGCMPGPAKVPLRGGTLHLPLLNGRILKYQERVGADMHDYTVKFTYWGGLETRVFDAQFKGIEGGQCRFLSHGGLVYFSTTRPFTALRDVPEFRQLWVDDSAAAGDTWEDQDTGTQTTFVGYEKVIVPAATFERCYKTVTTALPALIDSIEAWYSRGLIDEQDRQDRRSVADLTVTRWFAAGIGLVKEQIGDENHVRELVKLVNPGRGAADAPPENNPE